MYKIVKGTLASSVADSGTFTVGYPDKTDSGSFIGAVNHKMNINQVNITSPKQFTLTFGTSNITVTNKTGATLAAGAAFILQIEIAGIKPIGGFDNGNIAPDRAVASNVVLCNLGAPDAAASNAVCLSQSVTANTAALLNGATAGLLDNPRALVAAWTNAAIITITGKDEFGVTMVEKSASGTSFTGKKAFQSVTSVTFSADVTGATVGTSDVLGIPMFLVSPSQVLAELQDNVSLGRAGMTRSLNGTMADVSTASIIYLTSPSAGRIKAVYVAISAAVTVADTTVTISTAAGTVGTITIPVSGSAPGNVYKLDTGLNNTAIAAGAVITINSDGASSTASVGSWTVEIDTAGTYVTGDQTAGGSTATTGDIRGTYKPNAACDGSKSFQLLLSLPNPKYGGLAQYAG